MSTYKKKSLYTCSASKVMIHNIFFRGGIELFKHAQYKLLSCCSILFRPYKRKKYIFFLKKNIEIEAINLDIGGNNQPNGMCGSFLQEDPSC